MPQTSSPSHSVSPTHQQATFAGGCFWCMEHPFEALDGVSNVIAGYIGGDGKNPTYQEYSKKGHVEAVQITYDPKKVSYEQLLDVFWRQIDPTDPDGQFVDRGKQYRSAIFYHDEAQQKHAKDSKQKLTTSKRFKKPIVTEILAASTFWPAEEYHQDYATKRPWRYRWYRSRSGRDQFLNKAWSGAVKKEANPKKYHKPSDTELRKKLTPLQYKVTQQDGTEPAFSSEYWNKIEPGSYVDIVSGEPLFSSSDQFVSPSGWPSFTKPVVPENITQKEDRRLFTVLTEVRSKQADSHLGHILKDGPPPTGLRYCINGAALRFIPEADLEKEGYGLHLA